MKDPKRKTSELKKSQKKTEKMKMRSPWVCEFLWRNTYLTCSVLLVFLLALLMPTDRHCFSLTRNTQIHKVQSGESKSMMG